MPLHRLRGIVVVVCAIVGIAFSAVGPATASYKLTPQEQKQMMPVRDVRPGMKGYGLTVFRGTKIEKFSIAVVGILPKINAGKSLILIRMGGGPITVRQANIIGGMSGSPIYVNGKLLGAVSYGAMFPREPLALVTPIEDMLQAWDPDLPAKPSSSASIGTPTRLDHPVSIGGRSFGSVIMQEPGSRPQPVDSGSMVIIPLSTRLQVSGMSSRGMDKLRDILNPYGMAVAPGPGPLSQKTKPKVTLQPGSSVGISIASGDIDITGIGTLTYRHGGKIVAFGHPALGQQPMGPIDAAMTTAYVHDVMPSLMTSEKMASPIETVGRVSQDSQYSIGGAVGNMPKMIPVTIAVNDASSKRAKTFNVKVINHPLLSPLLINMVAGEAIAEVRPFPGEAAANVTFEVQADEVGKLRRENVVFNPISVEGSALDDLTELLYTLRQNRFHPVDIHSVKMWVNIAEKRNTAAIERIFVKEGKYAPGDTIDVGVVLRPYKMERITKYVKVTIPASTPSGRAMLTVRGGLTSMGQPGGPQAIEVLDSGGESGGDNPSPGVGLSDMATADNLSQLVKKFMDREKNNEIVAKLLLSTSAINIAGEKLSFLPPNISEVMRSPRSTSTRMEREEVKSVVKSDFIVMGSQGLPITIQKKDLSERKSPQKRDEPQDSPPDDQSSGSSGGSSSAMSMEDGDDVFPGSVEMAADTIDLQPEATGVAPVRPPAELLERARKIMAARAATQGSQTGQPSSPPAAATSSKDDKPVGRAATIWTQTTQADFKSGLLTGIAATSENDLRLSPLIRQIATDADSYVWSMVPDGSGGAYAGSGNSGTIYRVAADGKLSELYESSELEILSLAKDSSGNLYAGTSPNGFVYKISADGKASKILDADEKHIAALALDTSGNLYAATGDRSKVYRIAPDGKSSVFFSSADQNAQALAIDGQNNLYVATAPNGIVYKVTPGGDSSALYDASENSINAVAVDANGNVYVATGPKPTIVRIPASGTPKVVLEKASSALMELAVDSEGNVFAEAQDKVYKIQPDDVVTELDAKDDPMFVSMALDSSGKLFVGTANPGAIYATDAGDSQTGTYQSIAHDAKAVSQWGAISWRGRLPEATQVSVSTRSGNSADPDASWSPWSPTYGSASGSRISSPAARYIQYRVELDSSKAGATPELKDVSIAFMPPNQSPTLKIATPNGGEKWSKKQTVKWSGSDPDKDTLTYDVYYSPNLGGVWMPLITGKKAGSGSESKEPAKPSSEEKKDKDDTPATEEKPSDTDLSGGDDTGDDVSSEDATEILSAIQSTPDLPAALREKVAAEASAVSPKSDEESDQTSKAESKEKSADKDKAAANSSEKAQAKTDTEKTESTRDTSYAWDTKTVPDGTYLVKVVASDKTSNPAGPLSAEKISEPFVITNKSPRIVMFKKTMTVQADKSVKLEGVAWQKLVSISNAQYRVDNGDWVAMSAADGIFDNNLEPFELTTSRLAKGAHNIDVKVFDSAGNSGSQKISVKVE